MVLELRNIDKSFGEKEVRQGKLIDCDPEVMAAQLCLPVSVWINLCDREPEREDEVMGLIERHVGQFFSLYGAAK